MKQTFKPLTAEKMNALLAKLRKGATASFGWREVALIVERLGGAVEPIVGAVSRADSRDEGELPGEFSVHSSDRDEVTWKRADALRGLVSELPDPLVPGTTYYLEVGEVTECDGWRGPSWSYKARAMTASEGWRVRWTDGTTADFFPGHYDLSRGRTDRKGLAPYDAHRWLRDKGWEAAAARALGMEEHVPAEQRTRDGTGTCGVCFCNVKIPGGRLALHGYRRPGDGYTHGRCGGTDYQPFELSVVATEKELGFLRNQLAVARRHLESLRAGDVTVVNLFRREVKVGDEDWNRAFRNALEDQERTVLRIEAEATAYGLLVTHWRVRELPREGDRQINWYVQGQKPPTQGE